MARKISTVITDDLDGSPDAETVTFGLDGVNYEIDLTEANRVLLASALAPFIAAARRPGHRRVNRRAAAARAARAAIRSWAREAGIEVSGRGRLSTKVIQEYEAAHRRRPTRIGGPGQQ